MTTETPTVATPAPAAPAVVTPSTPVLPPAPDTLVEFRVQKAAALSGEPQTPPVAQGQPPDGEDIEGDEPPEPQAAQPQGPQPTSHRWKDPDTGVTLDLRRREHRRIKRLLEERADLARQMATRAVPQPQAPPQRQSPQIAPDPRDPEPALEQFADQPDPYGAYVAAQARWHARQEFQTQSASRTRVERARQVQASIEHAQRAFDAELPTIRARHPDFDDAHQDVIESLATLPMQVRAPIVMRLLTSPQRHDLTHFLGTHPEALSQLVAARSAYEQGMVLGAIEAQVRTQARPGAAPVPPLTPAPSPMAPVAGGASRVTVPDANTMNLAQFRANKSKFGIRA